jgi:hypothetical protein
MILKAILLGFILFLAGYSFAQYNGDSEDTLNCNRINAAIMPVATQFYHHIDENTYHYPANSHYSTLSSPALWIGGMDDNEELHLAGTRFSRFGHDFWSGLYTVTGGNAGLKRCSHGGKIYVSGRKPSLPLGNRRRGLQLGQSLD